MPELQSVFAAQEAPSGLPASPERVHRPVARLQMPEPQSVFVAQAAPSGACANADANTILVTAAAAISFVTIARNDAPAAGYGGLVDIYDIPQMTLRRRGQ